MSNDQKPKPPALKPFELKHLPKPKPDVQVTTSGLRKKGSIK